MLCTEMADGWVVVGMELQPCRSGRAGSVRRTPDINEEKAGRKVTIGPWATELVTMMLHTHKVLVVVDNDCVREVVGMCLKRDGIGVVEANDGSEAIEVISNLQYTNPD